MMFDDAPLDAQLIRSAAAGDPGALERLLAHFQGGLAVYIDRLMPPEVRTLVDPQDVIHDTCFEAFRRIGEFRAADADSAYRWLATIARHRVTDLVRTQRRAKRGGGRNRVEAGSDDSVIRLLEELAVYERTPSKSAMRHELRLALEQSISRLQPALREAVRCRYVQGMSYEEVAEKMSRTKRAVEQLCTRGLGELRKELRSGSIFL